MMAAGWFCVASLALVFLSQSILVGAENHHRRRHDGDRDGYRHHGKCHKLSKALGPSCEVKEDCTNITCASSFGGQQVLMSAVIDCRWEPASVDLSVRVPGLGIDWSQQFKSGDSISIPKFPLKIDEILTAQVNVTVDLEEARDEKLRVKVELLGWGEIAGNRVTPLKETIMDGELPVHCPEPEIAICDFPLAREKWRAMPWQARAAIVSGGLLFLVLLVSLCCCLFKKRGTKQQIKTPPKVFVKPSPDIMTTTKSKVPLEPLASEA